MLLAVCISNVLIFWRFIFFLRIDICIIVPKWLDLCKGFYLIPKGGKSVLYFHQVL